MRYKNFFLSSPSLGSYALNRYTNTSAVISRISYIDGDKGILRYRGYPIEELAAKSSFLEVAYLVLFRSLPTQVCLTVSGGLDLKTYAAECIQRSSVYSELVNLYACVHDVSVSPTSNPKPFKLHHAGRPSCPRLMKLS